MSTRGFRGYRHAWPSLLIGSNKTQSGVLISLLISTLLQLASRLCSLAGVMPTIQWIMACAQLLLEPAVQVMFSMQLYLHGPFADH